MDTPAVLSEETHSELPSPYSPGTQSGDEDSSKGEEYAAPLTSDTTAAIPSSTAPAVEEDDSHDSQSTIIPLIPEVSCLDQSIPPDQATVRVSIEQDSEADSDSEPSDTEQENKSPASSHTSLLSMKRSIYTAQSFQNWLNLLDINRPYMFPAIK